MWIGRRDLIRCQVSNYLDIDVVRYESIRKAIKNHDP